MYVSAPLFVSPKPSLYNVPPMVRFNPLDWHPSITDLIFFCETEFSTNIEGILRATMKSVSSVIPLIEMSEAVEMPCIPLTCIPKDLP